MHTLVLDGQEIGMPATLYLCWRFQGNSHLTYITTTSTQNKNYYILQDCSPYSCSSYSNINTNRPKNQTISSIYLQTSSCIQRSVQVTNKVCVAVLLLWVMEAVFNRLLFCCNGHQGTVVRGKAGNKNVTGLW
jgi:hypothetical protein